MRGHSFYVDLHPCRSGGPFCHEMVDEQHGLQWLVIHACWDLRRDHHMSDLLERNAAAGQVGLEAVQSACPVPFDEGRLWKGENGAALKLQLQAHFQNITAVMDCVGCDKCKLWGKLQLLGTLHIPSVHVSAFCTAPALPCNFRRVMQIGGLASGG